MSGFIKRSGLRQQQGLSLIGVAIFMALLTLCAMGALYWMRYERNPITDIMNGQVGKAHKAPPGTALKASSPGVAEAPPAAPQGPIRKCVIAGKTVYSDTECPKSAEKMKLHDSKGFAPPPKPVQETEPDAPATLQQKAMDKAIEKATR